MIRFRVITKFKSGDLVIIKDSESVSEHARVGTVKNVWNSVPNQRVRVEWEDGTSSFHSGRQLTLLT
jgi:translation initiation factor IF-1